ncbi:MAG: helix-turn-helix domain-containing protein [Caldilineaceae bacterium]
MLLAERQGQVTPRTLMDETGVSKATATRRLAELADSGFLARARAVARTTSSANADCPHRPRRRTNHPQRTTSRRNSWTNCPSCVRPTPWPMSAWWNRLPR